MEIVNDVMIRIEAMEEFPAAYDMMDPVDGTIVYEGGGWLQSWDIYHGSIAYRRWKQYTPSDN